METAKAARNRNDQSRPDTRRISSILKAPRTPLKTIGADNEDCQDEPTQPVETKRKSRRVSFAETNDIKYISNLKNNSPEMGLFPDLDITGGELQNGSKQTICATGNTRKQIIGMETLLNAPLHVSHQHNKENVFYPDAQDSNIDKTMMFLGEDTGYMDMTTCHTVNIIENDADDVPKLVSSSEMPGFASKVKTENNSSFENFWKPDTNPVEGLATSVGAQIAESQMEHFLTSLTEINRNSFPGTSCRGSKTTALGTSLVQCSDLTPCPKVDTKAFLSRLNDYRSGNAKEKQASAKTKTSENDITSTSSFPPQKNCIQFNSPTATNGKRQAVLTNEKDLLHEKQCSNGESLNLARNQSMVPDPNCHLSDKTGVSTFDLDDVEITSSQTVLNDYQKMHGALNPSLPSSRMSICNTTASNKTVTFSEDEYGMDMTAALTTPIEEIIPPATSEEEDIGMEMTTAHTMPIEKNCPLVGENKTHKGIPILGSIFYHEEAAKGSSSSQKLPAICSGSAASECFDTDDVEITRSQTVIDSKICVVDKPNYPHATGRKSLSCTPANKTVIFSEDDFGMEMTTALTVPIEDNTPVPPNGDKARSKLPSTNYCAHTKLTDCMEMASNHTGPVSHNMLPAEHSTSDDMDFTRSQTTVFDSKICTSGIANPEYSSRRKSLSCTPANKTVIFSDDDFGMEMTTALTVPIEENSHVPTNARKASFRFLSSKSIAHSGSPDHMELTSDQTDFISHNLLVTKPVDSEDIDISRSQSVVIDSKTCDIGHSNPSLASGRKSLRMPANRTVMFSDGDFGMEMTTAFTAPIEENSHVPSSGDKPAFRFSDTKCVPLSDLPDCMEISSNQSNTINQNILVAEPSDSDDRKITRSQTVAIDSQTCLTGRKSLSWESVKKTLSSEQGFGRKISTALSMPVKGSSHCTSVKASRETISSEQPDGTIMVSSQSAPNDEIHSLTTLAFVSNVEIRNEALGHHDKLRTLCGSEKISFSDMSTDPVSVEKNDNDIEMIAFTMPVEDNTCVKETTADTVSCFDLPDPRIRNMQRTSFGLCKNGMPEQGTQIAVSDSNIHLNAEESTVTRIAGDTVKETEKNLAPCDQRGLQKLSLMHSKLKANGDMDNVSVVDSAGTTCKENGVSLNDGDSGFIVHAASSQHENKSVRVGKKNSRRMSLADLQSKLNYMKAIIAEPVDVANECVTAPVLQLSSRAKDTIFESRNDNFNKDNENYQPALHSIQNASNEQTNMTAPVQCLKTKPRVGILSFGGFLPKLPQKNKTLSQSLVEITKDNHVGKLLTKNVLHGDSHLSSNSPVIYINDEFLPEISSEEDLTESIEGGGHANSDIQKDTLKAEPDQAADDEALLEKTVQNVAQGLKRPSPMDGHEDVMTEERKAKKPPDSEESSKFTFQVDRSVTDAIEENSSSTEVKSSDTTNSSNNSTYVRAEGTFDTSGQRCSQFETDFDAMGYKLDLQKKLEDGSIAVKEFLNFLGIDFVIHKPRQSVLPDNFALANEAQDLLVEKYINRPKQRVYEDDRQELSKMVENLKSRMLDQNKPLKMINQSFWEVVKSYSDEQFQSLGSALKARKVYFRKKSKTVSHEMKVGLYSSLVQTTQLAQQTLTEKIKEVDQLLQKLDDCLHDLQAELDATESKCFEEAEVNSELMLEAKQQELESLNAAVAENDRHISALQMENSNAEDKICKIQEETRELEKYSAILDRVIEWKLSVESESRAVFTFLYGSVEMEVLFQPHASTAEQTEQKVYDIRFHLQLDEGKSSFYARLIYKLISQFIQSKSNWVEKYPTRSSIPMLLHEVSLVVSRCRVLGEEIHRLWKWGSLKFDVVEIGCHDTQISFLFSSLKVFAKFEVTLAVDPTYPVSHLKVLSFKNYIGNTRLDQLEEIVSAVTPADNYLTRIVKKIHDVILC